MVGVVQSGVKASGRHLQHLPVPKGACGKSGESDFLQGHLDIEKGIIFLN